MRKPSTRRSSHTSFDLEALEPRALLSVAPITFTDSDGTAIKITFSGNGAMSYSAEENTLTVTGTDQASRIRITTNKSGDGRVVLKDIHVAGAIYSITATTTDLTGNISVGGNIRTLSVGDLLPGTPHTITIGGTSAAASSSLTLRRVVDLSLHSGAPIKTLKVADWDDTGADDLITAPSLLTVDSKEDLSTSARLIDQVSGTAKLNKVTVKGLLSGTWFVDGEVGSISAGTGTAAFHMNILGKMASLTTKGDFQGVVAAVGLGKISVGGNLTNAKLLGGADFGADALPGGSGANRDLFFRGTIASVSVKGQVINSVVGAGLDPSNEVFGDDDDFITGKLRSTIGTITVRGVADSTSRFAAGKFTKASVGGTRVDAAGDPRFLLASTAPDETPPVITAQLRTDSGTAGDLITNDPTVMGRVTDLGQVASFRVGIDDDALATFVNIRSLVRPDGAFQLSRAKIEQINGGPLTVGPHTINFLAKDDVGNTAAIFTVAFAFAP